jgi:hypothetical protein
LRVSGRAGTAASACGGKNGERRAGKHPSHCKANGRHRSGNAFDRPPSGGKRCARTMPQLARRAHTRRRARPALNSGGGARHPSTRPRFPGRSPIGQQ